MSIYAGNAAEAITELDDVLGEIAVMDMAETEKNGSRIFTLQNMATICFHYDMTDDAKAAIGSNSFLGNYSEARSDYDKGVELGQASAVPNLANYRAFVSIYAGNAVEAITELDGVLGEIAVMDMAETEKNGSRIFTLQNMATICFHYDMTDDAKAAIGRLTTAYTENAMASDDEGVTRQMKAAAAYWQGRLAAREGDFETAQAKAEEYAALLKDDQNPRRMENYHDLLGLTNLLQGSYDEAVAHYRQSNLDPSGGIWSKYHLAVALEKAGHNEEARELFAEVANYNFNSVGFALVRRDAASKT